MYRYVYTFTCVTAIKINIELGIFIIIIAVPVHQIPQRTEGWTLPWRDRHRKAGESKRSARCRRPGERRQQREALLLHHRTLHRFQVQCAHSEDWQQLQGIYVSGQYRHLDLWQSSTLEPALSLLPLLNDNCSSNCSSRSSRGGFKAPSGELAALFQQFIMLSFFLSLPLSLSLFFAGASLSPAIGRPIRAQPCSSKSL